MHTPDSLVDRHSSVRRKLPTPPLTDPSRVDEHVQETLIVGDVMQNALNSAIQSGAMFAPVDSVIFPPQRGSPRLPSRCIYRNYIRELHHYNQIHNRRRHTTCCRPTIECCTVSVPSATQVEWPSSINATCSCLRSNWFKRNGRYESLIQKTAAV